MPLSDSKHILREADISYSKVKVALQHDGLPAVSNITLVTAY